THLNTVKLGLIPSPDYPADLTSKIVDELLNMLEKKVDTSINCKREILLAALVDLAEQMNCLVNKVINIKKKNNWDYVICLTDLPQFMEKHIIMADINREQKVALVSLPAFGLFPIKKRIKRTINQVIREMIFGNADDIQNISMQS